MAVDDKKPVDVKKTLQIVAAQAEAIEKKRGKGVGVKDIHDLAVGVSCLAAIVDGHEERIRRLEQAMADLVGRGRLQ